MVGFVHGSSVTLKLCLNPYSASWQRLRDSPYAKRVPNGLIDPLAEEQEGAAYIADTSADRNNPSVILEYLQGKYSTEPLPNMDMGFTSVSLTVRE